MRNPSVEQRIADTRRKLASKIVSEKRISLRKAHAEIDMKVSLAMLDHGVSSTVEHSG